jgi:hypothetical protein
MVYVPTFLPTYHIRVAAKCGTRKWLTGLRKLAERTGLEPATPGVTGRCPNPALARRQARIDVPGISNVLQYLRGSCGITYQLFEVQ